MFYSYSRLSLCRYLHTSTHQTSWESLLWFSEMSRQKFTLTTVHSWEENQLLWHCNSLFAVAMETCPAEEVGLCVCFRCWWSLNHTALRGRWNPKKLCVINWLDENRANHATVYFLFIIATSWIVCVEKKTIGETICFTFFLTVGPFFSSVCVYIVPNEECIETYFPTSNHWISTCRGQ